MPLQATSGAASYDAFGGGVAAVPNYIEDVFSTYLYTGNSSTQTITNGIDLSTKGGMIWLKSRSNVYDNFIVDTVRGFSGSATRYLVTNSTAAQNTDSILVSPASTGFLTNGFTLADNTPTNFSGYTYASWTFRKQPKFFDVVTYTGTGSNTTISHSLGSVPACIMVKRTDTTGAWQVYHSSLANTEYLVLNTTAAKATGATRWNSTTPTSTVFSIGTDATVNASGGSYVAYLFAHDAGGFGLSGSDNVISCGSFTCSSGSATVSLGYEPQWLMIKRTDSSASYAQWYMVDTMRGFSTFTSGVNNDKDLYANLSNAEADDNILGVTSTGFSAANLATSGTYIYIAIRRGPMKVPTSGTSVFSPVARSGTGSTSTVSNSITTDLIISMTRNTGQSSGVWDRLRGVAAYLETTGTASESTSSDSVTTLNNTSYVLGADTATDRINRSGYTYANWTFRRAPSFFDEVCYTGTGVARTVAHNLGVVPELMIVKNRSIASDWRAYSASLGATQNLKPNTTDAATSSTLIWNDTAPTSSVFTVGTVAGVNGSGNNMVAYLFATCAGVSKMTTFTGNGSSQTINCGFTGGARFVLIKRVDSTGNWVTFDTARGIVSGNDPALYLNSTAAEVTGVDAIDPDSTGFIVNQESTFNLNVSSATYLVLAIA